nr:restriction endonuclease [Sphingomonas sp.]
MESTEVGRERIAPAAYRYIKLGPAGAWEAICLEQDRIDWGIGPNPHDMAAAKDWAAAKAAYVKAGIASSTATGFVRELKDFHTLGEDCLWITFARGYLWWAFAAPEVFCSGGDPKREGEVFRKVKGKWRNQDLAGRPLRIEEISSKLTQLAGYRGTICNVATSDYLLRRITAEEEPVVAAAREARAALVHTSADLIRQLHWADFELFVDLLFSRGGWRRVSAVGGRMKDIDLIVEQPLTGERASIQVKSAADQSVLDASVEAFLESGNASRFFFVCHSPRGRLNPSQVDDTRVQLWTTDRLAAAAVDHGL